MKSKRMQIKDWMRILYCIPLVFGAIWVSSAQMPTASLVSNLDYNSLVLGNDRLSVATFGVVSFLSSIDLDSCLVTTAAVSKSLS